MNKKAIELSINFIVILILSIVIMSSSFILVRQFFGKATEMKAKLDSDTETQIRGLLVSGQRVAIPLHTKEAKIGEFVTFGVGISNILKGGGSSDTFTISVEDDNCKPIGGSGAEIDAKDYIPQITIDKNDQNIALIGVDTAKGAHGTTYKCDIHVTYFDGQDWKNYEDDVYKAYVKIK